MVGKLLPSLGGHLNTSKSQQPREAAFKYDDLTCKKKRGSCIFFGYKIFKTFQNKITCEYYG